MFGVVSPKSVVLKLFWVAAPLKVFDSTAAHLELQHQTYSLVLFTLFVQKKFFKHCYLEQTMQNRKTQESFLCQSIQCTIYSMRNMCLFLRTKSVNSGLDIRQTYSQLLFNRLQIGSFLVSFQRQCRKRSTVLKSLLFPSVAYAGFSKGGAGNSENLRLMKTRMKIFQPKAKFVFLPKLR